MDAIDAHDLLQPVARAVESLVQALRDRNQTRSQDVARTGTAWDTLAPILEEMWARPRVPGRPQLRGHEAESHQIIVEKFRRQGLKL